MVNNMIPLVPADEVVSMSIWKEIRKTYRYEMKPSKNQEVKFIKSLNTLRHLHNDSLAERKDGWKNGGWSVRYEDQQSYLTVLRNKNDEKGKFLRDVYVDVEQDAIRRVDIGYQRFFKRVKDNKNDPLEYKKPGYPRFKGRNRYKSLTFTRYKYGCHILDRKKKKNTKGDINNSNMLSLRLSGIGDIKFIKDKEIGEIVDSYGNKVIIPYWIKTVNVKRYVDKLFVSFSIDTFTEIEIPVGDIAEIIYKQLKLSKDKEIKTIEELKQSIEDLNNKCKGHDMGLPNLITSSDGKQIEAPKFLKKSLKKLRREQRKLSRKQKYDELDENGNVKKDPKTGKKLWNSSKNREKQVIKVANLHDHTKNQRKNFNHEASRYLVDDNCLNIFENLNIQKMMQDHKYARGIADSGWYQIQRFTSYKAEESAAEHAAGKMVDFVDPTYTSQICSNSKCGKLVGRVEKGDIFKCPFCGLEINVHQNAAINIRNRSEVYQGLIDKMIYQRLTKDLKEKIRLSEERLRLSISPEAYCWSRNENLKILNRDAIAQIGTNRGAIAAIYAFGEVTSTHTEMCEQVASMNKETLSNKKDGNLVYTSIQAPPFSCRQVGSRSQLKLIAGRGS